MGNDHQNGNVFGNEALRVSELSYRRLFETAQDGILILDAETGRVNDVNPFLIKLLGFSHHEMVGKTVGELSPFKDIVCNQAMLARLQKDGYIRYHNLPLETKDGRTVAVEFVSNVYWVGDAKVIQCNVRDITQQRAAEQHLHLLNTCVSHLNEIILVTEADPVDEPGPKIVYVNDAFERLTGYTAAEAIGRSPRFLQGDKTDRNVLAEIHGALQQRQPIQRQLVNYKKDGTEYWMDIDIVPIFNTAGKCTHFAAIERDITEAKKVEAQLLWKTAFFEAQVNSALDAIIVVDNEGKKVLENPQMSVLWNHPREILAEVDHRRRLEWVASLIKNPRQFAENVAYLYAHPDEVSRDVLELNDGRYFDRYTAPVRGREGIYFGRIWTYRDITEKKRIEARFRRLVDSNAQGVIFWNTKGQITEANDSLLKLIGYTRADLASGPIDWFALTPPEFAERDQLALKELAAHGVCTPFEKDYIRKDGSRVTVLIGAATFEDNPNEGVSFVLDLTERKRADESVRRLAAIVDSSADAIISKTLDGFVTSWNPAAEKMFGFKAAEIIGQPLHRLIPSDLLNEEAEILAAFAGGEQVRHLETVRIRKDGRRFDVSVTISSINDSAGKPIGISKIVRDITERKKLEEKFRRAQKMESFGQLAGGVAHDFNNILGVILMQSDLLVADGFLSPEQLDCAKGISEAAQRAAALTRQLLLFSRKEIMQPRDLDLSESVKSMTQMLRRTLGEHIQMQFKFALQPLLLHADAGMLDQVLLNLAVNARDAMPKGGQLVIETMSVEFDETARAQSAQARPGSFVCLSVSDNGCGIARENLSRIFEPFFTTKDVGKGTGLGLATVFGIVQQHQGWVNVYSEAGQGTTFRIYLPRLATLSSPAKKHEPLKLTNLRGRNETILLVEDDDFVRLTIANSLSRLGYRVFAVGNGLKALQGWEARRDQIDLLVTDLVMPGGMNGKDLSERLMRGNPKLKVIYASGYSAEIVGKDFLLEEGVNFLTKPFQAQTLAQTIRNILD